MTTETLNYTTDELVAKYVEVRDWIAEKKKEASEILSGLEQVLLDRMRTQGEQSIRTRHGTCYRVTNWSITTSDKPAFTQFLIDNQAWSMLDARPNKEGVLAYMDEHKETPPGVRVDAKYNLNVRKS